MILLTDGKSTVDSESTLVEADSAKKGGIIIITIGITDQTDMDELRSISSPPQVENITYFIANAFSDLSEVVVFSVIEGRKKYCNYLAKISTHSQSDDGVTIVPSTKSDSRENATLSLLTMLDLKENATILLPTMSDSDDRTAVVTSAIPSSSSEQGILTKASPGAPEISLSKYSVPVIDTQVPAARGQLGSTSKQSQTETTLAGTPGRPNHQNTLMLVILILSSIFPYMIIL